MLVLDNNLLSDYLVGSLAAENFLQHHEETEWAVPSIVLYEACMGAIYGHIGTSPSEVRQAVTTSMTVLDTTQQTVIEAYQLQEDLLERGIPLEQLDALIAASSREYGGVFATADQQFWHDDVRSILRISKYQPA